MPLPSVREVPLKNSRDTRPYALRIGVNLRRARRVGGRGQFVQVHLVGSREGGPMHTLIDRGKGGQSEFSWRELPNMTKTEWRKLAEVARAASARAYCPYSRFPVGAAVLSGDGSITRGCNVENASFGLTSCAERNAVFSAVADGATSIVALALYTPTPEPVMPCGACRQVIAEFGRDTQIRCICDGPGSADYRLVDLLPHGFALGKR